jgi:hypothetical protein
VIAGQTLARLRPVAVGALAGVAALLAVASIPLGVLARHGALPSAGQTLLSSVPFAAVGLVVARHQPANPMGWLLATVGTVLMASEDGGFYALLRHDRGNPLPLGPGVALLSGGWEISLVLLPLVFLLFPDGRLSSRGWRWALRAYLMVSGAYLGVLTEVAIAAIVGHPLRLTSIGGLAAVDDPSGLLAASERAFLPLYLAFFLSFALRQVLSWRRSDGERRQQLKWLMIGAALCVLAVLVNVAGPALAPNAPPAVSAASSALGILFAGLPVCMGVAILRYRLYEIDRIISRTLAYAIVTGLLVGVYSGLVILATQVLGLSSPVAVAPATLVAAALFSPLRRRVQRIVDRRFNRARFDADQTAAVFAARLQGAVDLDTVRRDLLTTVQGMLEPEHASFWLNGGEP